MWQDELLDFWFGALSEGLADSSQRAKWFASDAQFDAECQTFEPLLKQQPPATRPASARDCLAHIVLNDQIPRNIYRGTAQAFAWDSHALGLARYGIAAQHDQTLAFDERAFMYMPFEHSEDLIDQHTAVGLFAKLRDEATGDARNLMGGNLRFAQQHRDIILRFGRFPHRNEVLGRTSSDAEQAYVAQGDGFGQQTSNLPVKDS